MSLQSEFEDAQVRVKTLPAKPDNPTLLQLYGLYKQGAVGDASGKRPGAFNIVARAKYDAWAGHKGTSQDDAQSAYIALVDKLLADAKG